MPSLLASLGGLVSPGITAATQAMGGYQEGQHQARRQQLADQVQQIHLKREQKQDEMRTAAHAATMRGQGYVPDAERGANRHTVLDGPSIDALVSMATGGVGGLSFGHPDADAPRYGASVGGYSYDFAGLTAQQRAAKVAQVIASTHAAEQRPELAARALEVKESEGAANRLSRERQTSDRLDTQERIAANRERARRDARTSVGTTGVTPTSRLGHISRLSTLYMKPAALGGLGLTPQESRAAATRDVDEMIAGPDASPPSASPAAAPPRARNQFLDGTSPVPLTGPAAPGNDPRFEAAFTESRANDPIEIAAERIKSGQATVAQLEASRKSPAFIAAVKQRAGIR